MDLFKQKFATNAESYIKKSILSLFNLLITGITQALVKSVLIFLLYFAILHLSVVSLF